MTYDFDNPSHAHAIPYLRLGLSPVPAHFCLIDDRGFVCSCGGENCKGKHPLLPTWRSLQSITLTERQVTQFFIGNRWANIGHLHGHKTGGALSTLVIDVDGDAGMDSMRELEHELGALPPTPTVLTGGGGLQHYFLHPGAEFIVPTVSGAAPGIDIRGDGGFSMLPPSIHPSEREYCWDVDAHIEDTKLAKLPDKWVVWVTNARATATMAEPPVPKTNAQHRITDGREQIMAQVVYRQFMKLYREIGDYPAVQTLIQAAWNDYSPQVDLSKPGRGFRELENKCRSILQNRHLSLPLLEPPRFE